MIIIIHLLASASLNSGWIIIIHHCLVGWVWQVNWLIGVRLINNNYICPKNYDSM